MIITGKRDHLEQRAAKIISESIRSILQKKDLLIMGIVGGSSVANVFEHLCKEDVAWEKIHLFMIDERLVPLDHQDSNYGLALPYFKDVFPEKNLHPFTFEQGKEQEGIEQYQTLMEQHGGKYDLVLVSSGEDGHIAALFPEHHSVQSEQPFFLTMDDSPKMPPNRMTASRQLIQRAEVGLLLFFGTGKAAAFANFQQDSVPLEQCPSKMIKNIGQHYILTDQEVDR